MPRRPPPMTMDEISSQLSELARRGTGGDRFRALKMISDMNAVTVALPPPLAPEQLVDRLAALLRAAGRPAVDQALARAFPPAEADSDAAAKAQRGDLDQQRTQSTPNPAAQQAQDPQETTPAQPASVTADGDPPFLPTPPAEPPPGA